MRQGVFTKTGLIFCAAANLSWLWPPPVASQPAAPAVKPAVSRSLWNDPFVVKELARIEQEELAKTPISLKMTEASLETVIAKIQEALPKMKNIEVRQAQPVRLSFDLKNAYAGQILHSAAGLAGCELHILPNRLLIAPLQELSKEEDKDRLRWTSSKNLLSHRPLQSLFARRLAADIQQRTAAQAANGEPARAEILFGNLGPEQQTMIRLMTGWTMYGKPAFAPPVVLAPDTRVSTAIVPNGFRLDIDLGHKSNPNQKTPSYGYVSVGDR